MPLARHRRARRRRVSAGARSEKTERRGSVARRETQERRGQGLGVQAAATAGVIAPCARAGLCAHGSSTGARGSGAVSDRAARSGAACAGRAPRDARGDAGRAGLAIIFGFGGVPFFLIQENRTQVGTE